MLSTFGGLLADAIDRRKLLVICQTQQMVFSFVLAWIVSVNHPSKGLLIGCVEKVPQGRMRGGSYTYTSR